MSRQLAAQVVFWIGLAAAGYTLAGYSLVLRLLASVRPRPVRKKFIRPHVSVVVVAHNEGGRIAAKIENLLAMDYPRDRLEIIIASDGSDDDTVLRARAYQPRVRVAAFGERRGKPAVLNEVVPSARGAIVVLADTRQRFDPHAISALAQAFADPAIGAVSGELMLEETDAPAAAAGRGAAMYWDREKRIRSRESAIDSAIGATGAIYAIRRDLFQPIPPDTLLDDVLIPMRIVGQGYRVIFEPAARAFDHQAVSARQEFMRKVRTIAGNFQLFARERWMLSPRRNRVWVQTWSHKVLRLALPLMFLMTFAANVFLVDLWFYQVTLAGQIAGLLMAAATWYAPSIKQRVPIAVVPYTVCFLCVATLAGFFRFLTGRQSVTWDRSSPPGTPAPRVPQPLAGPMPGAMQPRA